MPDCLEDSSQEPRTALDDELRKRRKSEDDEDEETKAPIDDVTGCSTCGKTECSPPISYIHGSERFMNGRAKPGTAYVPTRVEQLANMVTHGLWIPPSVLGIGWMLSLASTPLQFLAASVYGLALIALFSVSTIFHTISYTAKCSTLKNFFHIGDRAIIYIFIAASYTPWLALKNFDGWGTMMLWVVWISAVLGITYQYTFHEKFKWLETMLYVIIGVCPSLVVICMEQPRAGLYELALGGIVYISGVVFFKCDGVIPFAHAIWHCFVSIGACFHFIAVCVYLLGPHNEVMSTIKTNAL